MSWLWWKTRNAYLQKKVFTHQLLSVCCMICYTLLGAAVFCFIESVDDNSNEIEIEQNELERIECFHNLLEDRQKSIENDENVGDFISAIDKCNTYKLDKVSQSQWTFLPSLLFAFTILTTIGYGNITPRTSAGKIFCIVYGSIGIPLTMIIIANIGKWMTTLAKYIRSKLTGTPKYQIELGILSLLSAFVLYILIGSLFISVYEYDKTFSTSIYFNFITLTTVGLGDMVPMSNGFLVLSLIYITGGLALTTMAIEMCSDYLRKLHWFGRQMTNAQYAIVWFGGKRMTVRKLVNGYGQKLGIPTEFTDTIDFDQLIDDIATDRPIIPTYNQSSAAAATTDREAHPVSEPYRTPALRELHQRQSVPFIDHQDLL